MVIENIKNYTLYKLFFPKVAVIDRPGIIINKTISRFGREGVKTRVIYNFEDICVNLYLAAEKKLGREKADFLWYKIGKDIAFRYLLFAKGRKIPSLLTPLTIEHILNTFNSAGMSFAENINYNHKEKSLITSGKNCVICRKTKSGYVMAGAVSGILSSLFNENIEAEPNCKNCPNYCSIVANSHIKERYIPNLEGLKPSEEYYRLNFSFKEIKTELSSFTDLFKFKKICLDRGGKFCFQNKTIIPSEIGLSEIILKNYFNIGEGNLFKKTIIKTSKNIMKDILKDRQILKEKIKFLCNMLSAFGWGIPIYKKSNKKIIFDFVNQPIIKHKPLFRALILNGYLNYIFNKNLRLKNITYSRMEFIEIT